MDEMLPFIDDWFNENKFEDHPVLGNDSNLNAKFKQYKIYRKLARLHKIRDIFTGRKVLHVGAATGTYNFVLKHANPEKLIVLEPNSDNFAFLKKSNNVIYDDYIQARLEDLPDMKRDDYDLVFLGNLPVDDWCAVMEVLTKLPNVIDIVIQSLMFNVEYAHTKFFLNPELDHNSKSMDRYYLWDGRVDMECWSIGEIIRVATQDDFVLTRKHYLSKNQPIGWCDLVFSRLDKTNNV